MELLGILIKADRVAFHLPSGMIGRVIGTDEIPLGRERDPFRFREQDEAGKFPAPRDIKKPHHSIIVGRCEQKRVCVEGKPARVTIGHIPRCNEIFGRNVPHAHASETSADRNPPVVRTDYAIDEFKWRDEALPLLARFEVEQFSPVIVSM